MFGTDENRLVRLQIQSDFLPLTLGIVLAFRRVFFIISEEKSILNHRFSNSHPTEIDVTWSSFWSSSSLLTGGWLTWIVSQVIAHGDCTAPYSSMIGSIRDFEARRWSLNRANSSSTEAAMARSLDQFSRSVKIFDRHTSRTVRLAEPSPSSIFTSMIFILTMNLESNEVSPRVSHKGEGQLPSQLVSSSSSPLSSLCFSLRSHSCVVMEIPWSFPEYLVLSSLPVSLPNRNQFDGDHLHSSRAEILYLRWTRNWNLWMAEDRRCSSHWPFLFPRSDWPRLIDVRRFLQGIFW